jgi:hypothetical protein
MQTDARKTDTRTAVVNQFILYQPRRSIKAQELPSPAQDLSDATLKMNAPYRSNIATVKASSLRSGAKRLHFLARQHSVLWQSDGVQDPPSPCDRFRTGSTLAQHARLTMSPFELTGYVASTAMAFIGLGCVQSSGLSCVRSVAYESSR